MPTPLVERLAVEFVFVVVLILFVEPVLGLLLPAQHAQLRFDRVHLERPHQLQFDQLVELQLLELARRVRLDGARHVRRALGELSAAAMLNAGLARGFAFARSF